MISGQNNGTSGEPYSPLTSRHPLFEHNFGQCSTSNLSRSSAISVCSSGNISTNGIASKCIITVALPGSNKKHNTIELVVDLKTRLENVLNQIAVLVGLNDVDFFGLAVKNTLSMDDEYRFLDLETKVQTAIPKNVLKGLRRTTSGFFRKQVPSHFNDQSAVTLYLRVVCYVDNPILIRDYVALQLYYDQLRENALEYGQLIVPETCFTLATLALQADRQPLPYNGYGDDKSETPDELQIDISKPLTADELPFYVPDYIIKSQGSNFITQQLPRLQRELADMSRVEAQLMYCRYASQRPFHVNIHMYGIKRKKTDTYHTLWLGIGYRGLDVFEDIDGRFKKLIGSFDWASVQKIQTNVCFTVFYCLILIALYFVGQMY